MTRSASTPDPRLGQLISGRYRVTRVLGEGGMGTVYAAVHEAIEKEVALKILHREFSAHSEVIERFKREAVSASRIKHPNVIDVFDFGQLDDGSFFIAMEFLEGRDLGDTLTKVGSFQPEEAVRIILQVGRALAAAHGRGVIHRDLKPENIFLQNTAEGDQLVKLVDFGIAQLRQGDEATSGGERPRRLTKTGMIFGTPEYMAPEQARGQGVDERADIYAVGIILYELLGGGVPFTGQSFLDVLNHHVLTPVPPLHQVKPDLVISAELEAVVMRSLEKKPSDRFASVRQFVDALASTPEAQRSGLALGSSPHAAPLPVRESHTTAALGSPRATPLSSSTSIDEEVVLPKKSGAGIVAFALVAVALGGLGVAYSMGTLSPSPAPSAPIPASAASLASAVPPPSDPAPVPAPPSPPVEVASAAIEEPAPVPKEVVLRVTTVPAGAVVHSGNMQVCDKTPCEVTVPVGTVVHLSAKLGRKAGFAKVLAKQSQDVSFPLVAPSTGAAKPASEGEKLCEVTIDGLKILRPCH